MRIDLSKNYDNKGYCDCEMRSHLPFSVCVGTGLGLILGIGAVYGVHQAVLLAIFVTAGLLMGIFTGLIRDYKVRH